MKKKVFVAMSGGVDSSVAALLLSASGGKKYEVHGIYMKEWVPPDIICESGSDRAMAARVAAHLKIPFEVWDFRKEYKKQVADYTLRKYKAGRTPNPDVMCNKEIKFGIFLKKALAQGADFVATGHYVKMQNDNSKSKIIYTLHEAEDVNKDQTYFLWTLTQDQLQHCLFPIGDYTKPEVRKIAKKAGLPSWDKKDSQGICFIGKIDFANFLRKYLPHKNGDITTVDGTKIGTHDGVWFYTLGQRRGFQISDFKFQISNKKNDIHPMYIAEKDVKKNILIVAQEAAPELYKKELVATDLNWISDIPPKFPLKCKARIRYRQPLETCRISEVTRGVRVVFLKSKRAITSGQSIVFYSARNLPAGRPLQLRGRQVLGGGVIM